MSSLPRIFCASNNIRLSLRQVSLLGFERSSVLFTEVSSIVFRRGTYLINDHNSYSPCGRAVDRSNGARRVRVSDQQRPHLGTSIGLSAHIWSMCALKRSDKRKTKIVLRDGEMRRFLYPSQTRERTKSFVTVAILSKVCSDTHEAQFSVVCPPLVHRFDGQTAET